MTAGAAEVTFTAFRVFRISLYQFSFDPVFTLTMLLLFRIDFYFLLT